MEKKNSYLAPRIETLAVDAEQTMVNKTSLLDQGDDVIVVDPSAINKGNAGSAASKIQITDVWE